MNVSTLGGSAIAERTPGEERPRTRTRDPERKERILAAAADLIAQKGYHAVSIAEIGAAAGITGRAFIATSRASPQSSWISSTRRCEQHYRNRNGFRPHRHPAPKLARDRSDRLRRCGIGPAEHRPGLRGCGEQTRRASWNHATRSSRWRSIRLRCAAQPAQQTNR